LLPIYTTKLGSWIPNLATPPPFDYIEPCHSACAALLNDSVRLGRIANPFVSSLPNKLANKPNNTIPSELNTTTTLSDTRDLRSGPTAAPSTPSSPPSTSASTISFHPAVDALHQQQQQQQQQVKIPDDEPGPPSFQSLFATPESAESAAAAARKNSSTSLLAQVQLHQDRSEVEQDSPAASSLTGVTEPPFEPLPSFASVVSESQSSSASPSAAAAAVVADTKAALPRDTKEGSSSKDIDDGEPPPPYSEGSSPIKSFTYVMASAGGPASIITQVSQNAGPPINALGCTYI
jgi:hypothetical protein